MRRRMGNGPVNALDQALRRALTKFYPALKQVELLDYKVRVLSSGEGTGAVVRVLIESGDGKDRWGTVGVSHDLIEASWQALVDSIDYKLYKDARHRRTRRRREARGMRREQDSEAVLNVPKSIELVPFASCLMPPHVAHDQERLPGGLRSAIRRCVRSWRSSWPIRAFMPSCCAAWRMRYCARG